MKFVNDNILYSPLLFLHSDLSKKVPPVPRSKYWIVFGSLEKYEHGGKWLYRILKRGFWHVFVLVHSSQGWSVIDPTFSGLEIQVLNYPADVWVEMIYKRLGLHLIEVKKSSNRTRSYRLISCMYCVSIVKYVLGLKIFAIDLCKLEITKCLNQLTLLFIADCSV